MSENICVLAEQWRGQISEATYETLALGREVADHLGVPLTAILMGSSVTRQIAHPLAALMKGSEALARGDFDHHVAVQGSDELAELGSVFNRTSSRLRDLYHEL